MLLEFRRPNDLPQICGWLLVVIPCYILVDQLLVMMLMDLLGKC